MSRQPQNLPENLGERRAQGPVEPQRVELLADELVDQIAAGEVVERPASVVKELVENAVDAGACRVGVEIRGGGADLIAVSDDGCGMAPEDARRALQRHATSKLRRIEDLLGIRSFGFRGEALPAIASVSRFRLRTRTRSAPGGFELDVEAGVLQEAREVAARPGTRVEVADLFAAIPARRKFLKRPATEWGHIADWLTRAALALPAVHFDVMRGERPALHWPAVDSTLDRIALVLSEDDAAALVCAERQHGALQLRAYVSRPDAHRPTGSGIHLFVNARPVRDRLLRHALLQVYRDVLPRGRFPTALLFVEVGPDEVDVNVHPAKWEVRFSDPQALHQLVVATVRDALATRSWLGGGPIGEGDITGTPSRDAAAGGPRSVQNASAASGDWLFAGDLGGAAAGVGDAGPPAYGSAGVADERPFHFAGLRLLGQLLGTYLLAEHKGGLVLVDQHAAHERVLYERLRAEWLKGGAERQALLVPSHVPLAPGAAEALAENASLVRDLGYEVEPFGEASVMLRAVPALLAERDPLGLLRGLAEELQRAGNLGASLRAGTRILGAADQLFASMACHSARRAGEVLDPQEQRALFDALDAIAWAPTCPHGRPVAVPVGLAEIERRFGRA